MRRLDSLDSGILYHQIIDEIYSLDTPRLEQLVSELQVELRERDEQGT